MCSYQWNRFRMIVHRHLCLPERTHGKSTLGPCEYLGAWPWDPQTAHILSSWCERNEKQTKAIVPLQTIDKTIQKIPHLHFALLPGSHLKSPGIWGLCLKKMIIWRIYYHVTKSSILKREFPLVINHPFGVILICGTPLSIITTICQSPSHWCAANVEGLDPAAVAWRPPAVNSPNIGKVPDRDTFTSSAVQGGGGSFKDRTL